MSREVTQAPVYTRDTACCDSGVAAVAAVSAPSGAKVLAAVQQQADPHARGLRSSVSALLTRRPSWPKALTP